MNAESAQLSVVANQGVAHDPKPSTRFRDRVDQALGRICLATELKLVQSNTCFSQRLSTALKTAPERPEPPPRAWKKTLVDAAGRRDFVEDYLFPRQIESPPFGAMTCVIAPAADCRPDVHDQDELIFIYRGRGEVSIEDATMSVTVGDVVFIPRNRNHLIKNGSNQSDLAFFSVWWPRSS